MHLRRVCDSYARLALILLLAALAVLIIVLPLHAASYPPSVPAVRGEELQGFLADAGDMHFLGLEPAVDVESIVITLAYRVSEGALERDGVNFTVLAQEGLQAYLAGLPLDEAAAAKGAILHAGAAGTIAQAMLRAGQPGGYTVIVHNRWQAPTNYILTVHGGTLIDEGGQTLLRVPSEPETVTQPIVPEADQAPLHFEEEPAQALPDMHPEMVERGTENAGRASSISGSLQPLNDRHYYGRWPASGDGEIRVYLTYETGSQVAAEGTVNFWVLTQDSLRHVIQGALPLELNLATGRRPDTVDRDEMTATLRLGGQDVYTLIVFNESAVPADYDVVVEGALLVDSYGFAQTGKAAVSEQATGDITVEQIGLPLHDAEGMTAFRTP